jgi:hypothetical protein
MTMRLVPITLLLVLLTGCTLPWQREVSQTNLVFQIERNQLILAGELDGRPARLAIATARSDSVLSPLWRERLRDASTVRFTAGEKLSHEITVSYAPLPEGVDGILGTEPWSDKRITIDYFASLLTIFPSGRREIAGETFRFRGVPSIAVLLDGRRTVAVLETAVPDTMIVPGSGERRRATLAIGAEPAVPADVSTVPGAVPVIGNRSLGRFLLTIDYGTSTIGLWRDPRNTVPRIDRPHGPIASSR